MLTEAGRILRRIALPLLALTLLMVALGFLVTKVSDNVWPLTAEDDLSRTLEKNRSGGWNDVTSVFSTMANTGVIIATTAIAALGAWLPTRNWRFPTFLAAAVTGQALTFFLVQLFVERNRPDVVKLEQVAPTSSFPSGHTGASVALYGGLALLLASQARHKRAKAAWWLIALVPLCVAVSRVYRGDHHVSDVVASLLYASVVIGIMNRAFLSPKAVWGRPPHFAANQTTAEAYKPPRAAVVINPIKLSNPEDRERIARAVRDSGWDEPMWLETTVEDPGAGVTQQALDAGVDLVIVCGGDGTVRECAGALAGTDVPLAVVPAGTGNLLARNLGLPTGVSDAVHVALHGFSRRIDLGGIDPDELPEPDGEGPAYTEPGEPGVRVRHFTAMAGIGFDAAMMADAPDELKKKMGWAAYAVSGIRHMGDARMRVTLRLDGGEPVKRRARMVLVGNVGALQAGMQLLPGAEPDDGLLDVVVFAPKGATGWVHAAARVAGRRRHDDMEAPDRQKRWKPVEHFTAATVEITTDRPEPRELDGDPIGEGTRLVVRVQPGALLLRVPVGSH